MSTWPHSYVDRHIHTYKPLSICGVTNWLERCRCGDVRVKQELPVAVLATVHDFQIWSKDNPRLAKNAIRILNEFSFMGCEFRDVWYLGTHHQTWRQEDKDRLKACIRP